MGTSGEGGTIEKNADIGIILSLAYRPSEFMSTDVTTAIRIPARQRGADAEFGIDQSYRRGNAEISVSHSQHDQPAAGIGLNQWQ